MRLRLRVALRNTVNTLEPFVYSTCSLIHSIKLIMFNQELCSESDCEKDIFFLSVIGGFSVFALIRMFLSSYGRCKWYISSLIFLSLIMVDSVLYWYGLVTEDMYYYIALASSFVAMILSLIFISTRNIISELRRIGRSSSL